MHAETLPSKSPDVATPASTTPHQRPSRPLVRCSRGAATDGSLNDPIRPVDSTEKPGRRELVGIFDRTNRHPRATARSAGDGPEVQESSRDVISNFARTCDQRARSDAPGGADPM